MYSLYEVIIDNQIKRHFSDRQIQFYGAQLSLGLDYLHSKAIIYRSCKPENVMIDAHGYLKLTDFSVSKV